MRVSSSDDHYVAVCMGCHDGSLPSAANVATGTVDSFGLPSGHRLDAAATGGTAITGCSTCHDTHGVAEKSPMIPAKTINGVTAPASGPEACLACHNAANAWTGPGYPSTSAPTRDATGYPVLGTWPGPTTYASASNAHRLIPETTQTPTEGLPVRRAQGDCLYCHAAHGGRNAYDGLLTTYTVPVTATLVADNTTGSYASLCFGCHGGVTPSGFATPPVDIRSFVTTASGSVGHSIVTTGGTLPVGASLPCFECHNPHGSKRGNASMLSDERGGSLDATGDAGVRQFCFTCHTTADGKAGWDSDAGAYVVVSSASKVVGLPRDGGVLHLPAGEGHGQADTASCYSCHGNDYKPGGHNVHNPEAGTIRGLGMVLTGAQVQPVDITPPVTTANLATAFFGTMSLVATDAGGSGVAVTNYVLDGSTPATGTEIVAATEGSHTVEFWSADVAGNIEATQTLSFLVDRTAPATSSDATASYVGTATITLAAQDATGGSGVAVTLYTLDGGAPTTGTVVSVESLGPHELRYWSIDNVGNAETTQTATFTINAPQMISGILPAAFAGIAPGGASPPIAGMLLAPQPTQRATRDIGPSRPNLSPGPLTYAGLGSLDTVVPRREALPTG